jgi:hypothetical protein
MNHPATTSDESTSTSELSASVQTLTLPTGTYAFTVKEGGVSGTPEGPLSLPALQVSLAPVRSIGTIEFFSGATTLDRWLIRSTDVIMAKITGGDVSLLLTSVRTSNSPVLGIDIRRVENPSEGVATRADFGSSGLLPMRVVAHIRNMGDVYFNDGWIGCLGSQLWVEGFAVLSVGDLPPDAVEYCGINAEGFQTAWSSNQEICGSRGIGSPLLGFAIRLRPEVTDRYDCQYSGRFVSGATVGPIMNGAMCHSNVPGDPLWGVQLLISVREDLSRQKAVEESENSPQLAKVG